jgi:hypothetical protein
MSEQRRIRQRSGAKSRFRAEEIFAVIAAVITFILGALPMISFGWRCACIVLFLFSVADLCLRSERVKDHFPSPYLRLVLSMIALLVIGAMVRAPMLRQYKQEHLPPSIPFILGVPYGDNDSPLWVMLIKHYGESPAYNCEVSFYDEDRKNIGRAWLASHPGFSFPPINLIGESSKVFRDIPEIDKRGWGSFEWTPIDPNRQHYTTVSECRDGQFIEYWDVTRVNGNLEMAMRLEWTETWAKQHPEMQGTIFSCKDHDFSTSPLAVIIPPLQSITVNRGFQLNHSLGYPVAILDPNNHVQTLTKRNDVSCWRLVNEHIGEARLPSVIPQTFMGIAVAIYGILILVIPLYCLIGFMIMGESVMKTPEYIEGRQATENFEEGMKALFKVSKAAVVKAEKKQGTPRASRPRKPKISDKD